MAMQRYIVEFPRLDPSELELWASIPTSVVSDSLNRCQSMDARIKPCAEGMRLCGQARTVMPMPGDNSMLLHAVSLAEPGQVVVVAGGGLDDVALAGEWVARCGKRRGLGGVVIDGSVRDVRDIRQIGFPIFARGAVPRGPHKNFGGRMDVTASVGNTPVQPGDIVIGDDDGVVVVPLSQAAEVLKTALALLQREKEWTSQIESGRTLIDVLGMEPAEELRAEQRIGAA
ncbi:RraA family protein [Azospirillum sp. RWY-5-1]|uniref:Putative 4-hydroxy-4-methyl-2-oxoglutarate aldolase n=1 Tax=Azospirillum oleiclasticum TaxID=2735135 RepID=A0ABX2THT6_9PROT|nr:RraA family protein [Azospirillum oleiclasticum]NYZ15104.1 RraA family protein [Azospirillum oleiclasticum]NYZ22866.1 RraA family protein [Azospirillum oleiclasticum]